MIKMRWKSVKILLSASAAAIVAGAFAAPTTAFAQQCAAADEGPAKTLDPRVGQELQKLYELLQNEQQQQAIAGLTQLLNSRGDSMKAYDKSTVYELRGSANAQVENFAGAKRDFQAALNAGGLPANRNNQLRYFLAQLEFQDGNYQQAITGLNNWIQTARACNERVDSNAYYLLAAAYTQISPPRWQQAEDPGERALAASKQPDPTTGQRPAPKKSFYDLMNLIYSELNNNTKRGNLLEEMVNIWPGEKSYWTQLSGLYSQTGRDQDAFSVIEVAYRAGLLTTEAELKTVIQYYSYFDNPYRGAEMLSREMDAGNIKRNQDNLVLLSQLWSQAREHKRAIPILREAAGNSSRGELSYRLGQVLLADEQYAASQRALEQALNKGGMDAKDTGDAWLLLGTARFSQAGPEDTAIWSNARQAFVNAQRYQGARAQSSQWISYIDAVVDTYRRGKELERIQVLERCQDDQDRLESQERIRDLQNRQITEEERAFEESFLERCAGPLGLGGASDDDEEEGAADEGASEGE